MPSPSTLHFWRGTSFAEPGTYDTDEAFFADLAKVFQQELAELYAAGGRYAQLDEVPLAMLCDPALQARVRAAGGSPDELVDLYVEAINEAEYHGRNVPLGKPMRGDVKKFKVYVKDPKTGNIKKVNFGHGGKSARRAGQKTMRIKKSNPARRRNFRARHHCSNPGPRTKARYWSCRAW